MAYRVLILDDDTDFNSLLTDIFEQADYSVTSLEDPVEAVEAFASTDYDLVVTDHKMPEMTGAEFMTQVKQLKPGVPVVIVSGYLENDTIRELIREGVGGVFLKPLNIFSLLERTAELIEEARKLQHAHDGAAEGGDGPEAEAQQAQLGFHFHSFPCKSEVTVDFAERLYGLRNFKSVISLIGHPGTHYRQICEDLQGFYESEKEQFVYFSSDSFQAEDIVSKIKAAQSAGGERVTCVLLDVEHFNAEQKQLAVALPKREGVFEPLELELRVIFCVSGDLDFLYDEGLIDENLYILMGTAEVNVPALKDCPNDLTVLAQQIIADIARERRLPAVPHLERAAREFLRKHAWERNYAELSETLRKLVDRAKSDVLTKAALWAICTGEDSASPRARLLASLTASRTDYLLAASLLYEGDRNKVASFFGADTASIENALR